MHVVSSKDLCQLAPASLSVCLLAKETEVNKATYIKHLLVRCILFLFAILILQFVYLNLPPARGLRWEQEVECNC